MNWIEVLDDARNVEAIYGDKVPSLRRVVLHEIRVHRDGPRVTLVIDLPDFPDRPPRKWAMQGFNTVQIALVMDGVVDLTMDGLSVDSVIDIDLAKISGEVHMTTSEDSTTHVVVRSGSAFVGSISAYLNGAKREVV